MQKVSPSFIEKVKAPVKQTDFAVMIAWDKKFSSGADFFTLDKSTADGGDFLKGNDDTITLFDKYYYYNESCFVKNFKITKKVSNYSWGVVSAQATITLNNGSNRFLPGKSEKIGDYIKAGRPIKIMTGYDGQMITNFIGFTGQPVINIVEQTVEINAFDAITYLDTRVSKLPAFVNKYAHEIIRDLLLEQGLEEYQFDIDESKQERIGYLPVSGREVTNILSEIAESEMALFFVDETGILRFWNRTHFYEEESACYGFNFSNLRDLSIKSTPIINSVRVISKPYKIQKRQKIWELDQGSDETLIKSGKSIDIFANFKDGEDGFYGVEIETPSSTQEANKSYYKATKSSDGTGEAVNVSLTSFYNFGSSYKMTFKNNSEASCYISKIKIFGIPAKPSKTISEKIENIDSVKQYGANPDTSTGIGSEILKIENKLIQDEDSARAVAANIVKLYSSPNSRFILKNFFVPHLQLGDAVELKINGMENILSCYIMGYELAGGVNANFRQTLEVEERPKSKYFQLDRSELDGGDILAD